MPLVIFSNPPAPPPTAGIIAQPTAFSDETGANTGTALAAAALDGLAVAANCLIAGGVPSVPVGMTLTMPATIAVVSGGQVSVPAASLTITPGALKDNYVYLGVGGVYSQAQVPAGSTAPTTPAGTILLFAATTNAGGSAVIIITQLASPAPIHQDSIQVDLIELASADVLSASTTSGRSNANRIRKAIANLWGAGGFPAAVAGGKNAILSDGSNSNAPTLAGTVTVSGDEHITGNLTVDGSISGVLGAGPIMPTTVTASGDISSGGHYLANGPAPTFTNNGDGTGMVASGNDVRGLVALTFSSSGQVSFNVHVAFHTAFTSVPYVVASLNRIDGTISTGGVVLASNVTTTGFDLAASLSGSGTTALAYQVIG